VLRSLIGRLGGEQDASPMNGEATAQGAVDARSAVLDHLMRRREELKQAILRRLSATEEKAAPGPAATGAATLGAGVATGASPTAAENSEIRPPSPAPEAEQPRAAIEHGQDPKQPALLTAVRRSDAQESTSKEDETEQSPGAKTG
jgi:hypothetical protein